MSDEQIMESLRMQAIALAHLYAVRCGEKMLLSGQVLKADFCIYDSDFLWHGVTLPDGQRLRVSIDLENIRER